MLINRKHKKIVLNLRDPGRILGTIPSAKTLEFKGKTFVVVPHRTEEIKILANLGFSVESSIESYYDWSGDYRPMLAQIETARFLTANNRAYCNNGLGTGKTLSTLWAFDWMHTEGVAKRLLVVAPLSTLERTWGDELFRNFPHLSFSVLYGTKETREKLLRRDRDVYIINHDGVKPILAALVARKDLDTVVIDELSQAARNAGTQRWRVFKKLIEGRTRVWGLTGTPIPNEPTDAWAQCKLITPNTVPAYFTAFRSQVMVQISQYKWVARPDALDIVYKAMQPAIRFSRDDCMDLPPVMYETREIPLSGAQKRMYQDMLTTLHAEYKGEQIDAVNQAVKLMKLVQVCAGAVYSIDGEAVVLPAKDRLDEVVSIVTEAAAKTIVYVPFRSTIWLVRDHIQASGFTCAVISGEVPKRERDNIFSAFQREPDPQVIVAQPAAMSHGLTLTEANVIVWYAPITSADIYEQANARITRPGQKHNQLIVNIQGSPVEARIYKRLKEKNGVQGILLDMIGGTNTEKS